MAGKIAGARIEWPAGSGEFLNWGDDAPDDLVAAHPDWVVDKRPTAEEVDKMTKQELSDELHDVLGHTASQEIAEGGETK